MASLRTPTLPGGWTACHPYIQDFPSCVTGDTVFVAPPGKSFQVVNVTTADAVTAQAYSSTTNLFTVAVANTPDVHIWVLD